MTIYKNIKCKNILNLLAIISNDAYDEGLLEKKYLYQNYEFHLHLDFCIANNIINIKDNKYSLTSHSFGKYEDLVIHKILSSESMFADELNAYILNFNTNDYTFILKDSDKYEFKEIANFLACLDILSINDNVHKIEKEYIKLLFENKKKFTIKQLIKLQERNRDKGRKAEFLILELERTRLRKLGINKEPIHVADDLSLGYDILSYDVKSSKLIEKYIEVKAVPSDYVNFYWSDLEVKKAEEFSEKYYLYLLPNQNGAFFTDSVHIIHNPFQKIFY